MLDQIITDSYHNFLSKKSECEINQNLSKWRSKRGIGEQSFSASRSHGSDCCPAVVDSLTFIALLGFIGAATYFLQFTITMNLMRKRRKRSIRSRRPGQSLDFINLGTKISCFFAFKIPR